MFPGTHALTHPDKPAAVIAETGQMLTYGQLDNQSLQLASYMYVKGLRRGDHIAMVTDNNLTAFVVYWAALRSGLYITVVNSHLSADEAGYIVNDCGATVLVVSHGVATLAAQIRERTPSVTIRLCFGGAIAGYDAMETVLSSHDYHVLPEQPRGADMLYSSGTTGRPKGIKSPLPTHAVDEPGDLATAVFGGMYGFDSNTIYLSPAPIYHAAPLRFCGVVQSLGGTVVVMRRFDPEVALAAIEQFNVTHSQWVPTMFVRILKLDEDKRTRYDLSTHRVAIHAAAPCPIAVKQAMIDWWGPILHEYYSSTEANGGTFISAGEWLNRPGSVGRAAIGTIRICDDAGNELDAGQVGTVYFEREQLPFEYHNDAEKTVQAQHHVHTNWTTTRDIGYIDEEQYLYLTDRKAFMIISGGVNIYPQEIENALALHPLVDDVAVVGVPDDEMGQSVCAYVQPSPENSRGVDIASELNTFLRARIAHYKVPRTFLLVDELPRTPTGKLVKGRLAGSPHDSAPIN